MNAKKCFICREWSWDVSKSFDGVPLCLPCYVDVLEVRQARGAMVESQGPRLVADEAKSTGRSPSPFLQMDLFN